MVTVSNVDDPGCCWRFWSFECWLLNPQPNCCKGREGRKVHRTEVAFVPFTLVTLGSILSPGISKKYSYEFILDVATDLVTVHYLE